MNLPGKTPSAPSEMGISVVLCGAHQNLPQPITVDTRQAFVGGTRMGFGWGGRQGDRRALGVPTSPSTKVGPAQDAQKEKYREDEGDEDDDASVSL